MNNNTTWFEIFLTFGFAVICLVIVGGILAFDNPRIDTKCTANGGQVFATPGHLHSCLYPAK
jgi:hypothetical protein